MSDRPADFAAQLEGSGFVDQGGTRRGGQQWSLAFNRYLTFHVHDFGTELVFTWDAALGDFFEERGLQLGTGETSYHELYPRHDVRLAHDMDAVRAEITRTLRLLRIDLGDPGL